ncbi:MAG: NFACT RNA binding domain-containing protein [Candidatus Krumholzibacteriia bacterium]
MTDLPPWRRPDALRTLLAAWRHLGAGRTVARAVAGTGWLRLTLVAPGAPAAHLFLCARPGAALLCDETGPPDPALREALGEARRGPPADRLAGARLLDARPFPADLAVALTFAPPGGGPPLRVVLQLHGSRGNLLLVDAAGGLVWALYPAVTPALLADPAAGPAGAPDPPDPPDDADPPAAAVREEFRAAARAWLETRLAADLATGGARAVRTAVEATARLRANLARDLAEAARGDDLRRAAEALAAALPTVPRGIPLVAVADPAGGPPLDVAMDPARSPAANMEEYFRRARKAERGRAQIADRLAQADRRAAALDAARAALATAAAQADGRIAACLAWRRAHAGLLGLRTTAGGGVPREGPGPARPFRRYLIEGRWELWVGRDNAENDLLTHHTAAPDDIWLHAQGVPGSHAVLRTAGRPEAVPRQVLEKAAALTALHSRARHSALVPVIHTLRKYVRKPRRSPPGAVTCQREKTLFAPPGVPDGVAPA